MTPFHLDDAIAGCIIGTAVGDAIGLPAEGLSRRRQRRLFGVLREHRFLAARGMVSDDTEHTCLVAEALACSVGEPTAFERELAARLRWWLAALPAGVGFATARALIRLCLGVPPHRSGVFSAGNGPAMRSALLGVCYGADRPRLRALVRVSTRLTHTDPKAEWSAYAVALAASWRDDGAAYQQALAAELGEAATEFLALTDAAIRSVDKGESTEQFADSLGLQRGVTGYCFHTVPVALHAWLRHPEDCRAAVLAAVHCGGDTDTTGAIVGAIAGARVGVDGIPGDWLSGIVEWPRTVDRMRALAQQLAVCMESGHPQNPLPVSFPGTLLRNAFFTAVAVVHVARRVLPPYY